MGNDIPREGFDAVVDVGAEHLERAERLEAEVKRLGAELREAKQYSTTRSVIKWKDRAEHLDAKVRSLTESVASLATFCGYLIVGCKPLADLAKANPNLPTGFVLTPPLYNGAELSIDDCRKAMLAIQVCEDKVGVTLTSVKGATQGATQEGHTTPNPLKDNEKEPSG